MSLVRTVPNESWIRPRYRTIVDFNSAYGELTETNPKTTIKTNIIHAGVEQDEYLSQRVYAFGSAAWDHSLSQGLDLQQTYGGGLGWTVFKTPKHELDLKGEMAYVSQQLRAEPGLSGGGKRNIWSAPFSPKHTIGFSRTE